MFKVQSSKSLSSDSLYRKSETAYYKKKDRSTEVLLEEDIFSAPKKTKAGKATSKSVSTKPEKVHSGLTPSQVSLLAAEKKAIKRTSAGKHKRTVAQTRQTAPLGGPSERLRSVKKPVKGKKTVKK